jgi:glucose-6-phosphate dehydrogenase assembly protein OpcA
VAAVVIERFSADVAPEGVEQSLAALWRQAARNAPIARALASNLVIITGERGAGTDVAPIEELASHHPARIVVLRHSRERGMGEPLSARVGILVFGPAHARFGVEEIAISSCCSDASLPSLVRRVTLGDVPTSIWWSDDLSHLPPIPNLVTMGRQLVYDSRGFADLHRGLQIAGSMLKVPGAPHLADLNWRRLRPIRQALASAMKADHPLEISLDRTEIRHRCGESALGLLFAGWLASRLGSPTIEWPAILEGTSEAEELLHVSFGQAARPDLTMSMDRRRVLVRYGSGASRVEVPVPHESTAEAIGAELRNATRDVCLQDALKALERYAAQS